MSNAKRDLSKVKQERRTTRLYWVLGVHESGADELTAYVTKLPSDSIKKWGNVQVDDKDNDFLMARHKFDSHEEAQVVARSLTYYDDFDRFYEVRKLTTRFTVRVKA